MHDIQTKTVKATEIFLEEASQEGFEIVPIEGVTEYSYGDRVCELQK